VGGRSGMVADNLDNTGIRSPDRANPSESQYRLAEDFKPPVTEV